MKEINSDIENISIKSNSFNDSNGRDTEKSVNFQFNENQTCTSSEDYELNLISSTTPERRNLNKQTNNCILCRDYVSPICMNCKNSKFLSRKDEYKENEKIIPNGKVKALAKQFEEIFPETRNTLGASFELRDGILIKCETNQLEEEFKYYNSTIKHENYRDDIHLEFSDLYVENISNTPSNVSASSTSSSNLTKKQFLTIKDPSLCESIDPIQAIVNSSKKKYGEINESILNRKKSVNSEFSNDIFNIDYIKFDGLDSNETIFNVFESLNAIEQRALLITWITTMLGSKEKKSQISENDNNEILEILKRLVDELEHEKDLNLNFNSCNEKNILSITQATGNENKIHLNTKLTHSIDKFSKTDIKIRNNSGLQINFGIPEDKEIEEDYIMEFTSKKNQMMIEECYSIIIDESKLSPKSDISLSDLNECENSILEMANEFFGFSKRGIDI